MRDHPPTISTAHAAGDPLPALRDEVPAPNRHLGGHGAAPLNVSQGAVCVAGLTNVILAVETHKTSMRQADRVGAP